MNRLQRKIKKLNENTRRLFYEVKQDVLTKNLISLLHLYFQGKINDKDFYNRWKLSLKCGSEGYIKDGAKVNSIEDLKKYLMDIIVSACNAAPTNPPFTIKTKNGIKALNADGLYQFLLSKKDLLGFSNSLLYALQYLQAEKIVLENETMSYKDAMKIAVRDFQLPAKLAGAL